MQELTFDQAELVTGGAPECYTQFVWVEPVVICKAEAPEAPNPWVGGSVSF